MTVFSAGDFDLKLKGLFMSFDVDNGGTIDRSELLTFLFAAIYGLCKLLDLCLPNRNNILDYSYAVFAEMDLKESGEITFEEFAEWIRGSIEL